MDFLLDWPILRWDAVRGIANNGLTRAAGIIPLVGYLILFNDRIADFMSFNTIAGVGELSPSPFLFDGIVKLRLTFFGSLFLLSSYCLFRIFRPAVLNEARGDLDFSSRVWETYSVYEIAFMEDQVFSDRWRPRTKSFWVILGRVRQRKPVLSGYRPDVRSAMFAQHGDYIRFLSREWWMGMMHTYRGARVAAMVFGIGGYLFLAVPSIDIAQAVLREVVWGR
ncbi:hypothetical protein [Citreimonas salinaria]|uniref:Uncharacterized protein n=1 Tax=Citreimonas salinaria TaxID=321339 RepID=A0A1H3IPF0_9RHOB|nr:hypothetical protein [Citreimonas salinaria]SDY29656.1 hypothetical protein SAMN05444340_105199 [Citreimonas salinaria]